MVLKGIYSKNSLLSEKYKKKATVWVKFEECSGSIPVSGNIIRSYIIYFKASIFSKKKTW